MSRNASLRRWSTARGDRRGLLALVLVVSALLAGCGGVGTSTRQTVVVVTTARLGDLDTWGQDRGQQDLLQRNVFQTLLSVGPDSGEPQNDLAESCRFSAPTAYTCRLKAAGFPDGTPVSPADIAWTFNGRYENGAAAGSDGTRWHGLIRSIETVDDHTFTLELTRADASLPYLLTLPSAAIVRNGSAPSKAGAAAAVGSGPYRVESASAGRVVLVANPNYSSAGTVGNSRVEIRRVADAAAGTSAVADGSADLFYPGTEQQAQGLIAPAGDSSQVVRGASLSIAMLALDQVLPAESDQPVRQALAALLDREALGRASAGTVLPLFSVLPNDVQWSTGPALEGGPDAARAAELLRGAGVHAPVPLRMRRPAGWPGVLWNELLRQVRAGGLFRIEVTDSSGGSARIVTESPDTTDPLAYLSLANGVDTSAGLAALIPRARADTDLASREQSVIAAQQQFADRSVALPLWQGTSAVLTRAGVERVSVSPFLRLWLLRPPG